QARGFAGTQFTYPADFLPCTAAKAEFDLAPGETRIVKARWPRDLVPAPGTHSCLLASIITRADHPVAGRQASEHNNLAQKNLIIVSLAPAEAVSIPVVLGNWHLAGDSRFDLELLVPALAPVEVSLTHKSREFFQGAELPLRELASAPPNEAAAAPSLDCGGSVVPASNATGGAAPSTPRGWKLTFSNTAKPVLPITLAPFSQTHVNLELSAPPHCKPANPFKVHFVQRNPRTRQIVGGIAVEVLVRPKA
ncbi:MAG TPA: hypothetical protein VNN80_14555, partial [Polyangiaceae bacterium]|nr:hypothetical protein [Polyangiaceae bacterium]